MKTLTMMTATLHIDSSPPLFSDFPSKGTTTRLKTFDDVFLTLSDWALSDTPRLSTKKLRNSSTLRQHLRMLETRILYSLGAQCAARDLMMVSLRHTVKRF